jgi:hypothetical protein
VRVNRKVWDGKGLEHSMLNTGFSHFAEALVFVHGRHAAGEAARHATLCEKSGDTETAAYWRKLQDELVVKMESRDMRRYC